uniref:G-patch domain-containing protein n=1 Tax=Parascaris univalens TaxID=6257 RepID=A0A915ARD0_PARUN
MSITFNKVRNRDIIDRFRRQRSPDKYGDESRQDYNVCEPTTSQPTAIIDPSYALIRNIPNTFHSKDLRRYFSDYVENGKFSCFHFRHRPEIQRANDDSEVDTSESALKQRCCCVVRFTNANDRNTFIRNYHMKLWSDSRGNEIPLRCFVFAIKVAASSSEEEEEDVLSAKDLKSLIELRPPALMPYGNVGTPSEHFLEQIRLCKLPPTIVGKLGIQSKRRMRKFGAVPLEYGSKTASERFYLSDSRWHQRSEESRSEDIGKNIEDEHLVRMSPEERTAAQQEPDNDEGEDDDKDECEEWERYEANYDDVTEQDRTKAKKYEEEIEVTWEKGGPGLVWYTDTFYWNQIEQGDDCDWKWADDWDVDYAVYYDRTDGSLDAKQAVEIREDEKLRSGEVTQSCFKKRPLPEQRKRRASGSDVGSSIIGDFEKYTKGIGSKLMRRSWIGTQQSWARKHSIGRIGRGGRHAAYR